MISRKIKLLQLLYVEHTGSLFLHEDSLLPRIRLLRIRQSAVVMQLRLIHAVRATKHVSKSIPLIWATFKWIFYRSICIKNPTVCKKTNLNWNQYKKRYRQKLLCTFVSPYYNMRLCYSPKFVLIWDTIITKSKTRDWIWCEISLYEAKH